MPIPDWTILTCFNPAILQVRRDPNSAESIELSFQLLLDHLNGRVPEPSDPDLVPVGPPTRTSSRLLSIDIETAGSTHFGWGGSQLAPQTQFHPHKSRWIDGHPLNELVQSVSITEIEGVDLPDGPIESSPAHTLDFTNAKPGKTRVFFLHRPLDRLCFRKWLQHASVLVGHNLAFDFLYLRYIGFGPLINPDSHLCIDTLGVAYLYSELLPSSSLKDLGPMFASYTPAHALDFDAGERFQSWRDPKLAVYNAEDTHCTALILGVLARAIRHRYGPDTSKLSDACLRFYHESLWLCISMSEAGYSFDSSSLHTLDARCLTTINRCEAVARSKYDLVLSKNAGPKPKKSRDNFLLRVLAAIDEHRQSQDPEAPSILDDPRLTRTDKRKEISLCDTNRELFRLELPPTHPIQRALKLIDRHTFAIKIRSTYVSPLLVARKSGVKKRRRSSLCIPRNPPPNWVPPPLPSDSPDTPSPPPTSVEQPTPSISHRAASLSSRRGILRSGRAPSRDCPSSICQQVLMAFPTWFPFPSRQEGGDEGGTEQARITARNPARQTDPEEIQNCYCSRFPGGILLSKDLDQAELRTAAVVTGEPSLIQAYTTAGVDLHTERAIQVFTMEVLAAKYGPVIDKKTPGFKDTERHAAKQGNFADLFDSSAETLQLTILRDSAILIPLDVCQKIVAARRSVRPVLCRWQDQMVEYVLEHHRLELHPFGISRTFHGSPSVLAKTYKSTIINFPIQAYAAMSMLHLQFLLRSKLADWTHPGTTIIQIANTYDSVTVDASQQSVESARSILADCFHESFDLDRPNFWSWLCGVHGHRVPMSYELKSQ
jgi:hypothetical protein